MIQKASSVFAILLIVALPFSASALTLRAGETPSIGKDDIVRGDLYIAGAMVAVSGLIEGDLIAAGGRVIVNGPVTADLVAAGGTVDILGRVGDDVRLAGGQVTVGSDVVTGDLVVAGGNVHVLSTTNVQSDLVVGGGNVILDGKIDGNVRLYGGTLTVNGEVGGTLEVYAMEALTLGPRAVVRGDLVYTSPEPIATSTASILGKTAYTQSMGTQSVEVKQVGAAILGTFFVIKFLVTLVTVLVLLFVFRRFVEATSDEVTVRFSRNAVIGFAGFIAIPAGLIMLMITLLGMPLAFLGGLLYAFSIMLAYFVTPVVTGALLSKWLVKESRVDWKWTLLGVLVLTVLTFVPIIGWIIPFILFVATLGALLAESHRLFWTNRK